jgi:NTE family protein
VFREGNLATLIRASFSLPVILRPVEYQDMLLVDGGVTNPLPLNRVDRKEGDILVALNVSAPIDTGKDAPSQLPFSLLDRVSDIMLVQNSELIKQLCPPDMEMQIAINDLGTYDYDKADELIALGHELMTREIDRYEKTHS